MGMSSWRDMDRRYALGVRGVVTAGRGDLAFDGLITSLDTTE